jgi:hypothetical protein
VKAFQEASLPGRYYKAFVANSKNYAEKSSGILAWTEDCRRLLDRCVARTTKQDAAEVRQAFEITFGLGLAGMQPCQISPAGYEGLITGRIRRCCLRRGRSTERTGTKTRRTVPNPLATT